MGRGEALSASVELQNSAGNAVGHDLPVLRIHHCTSLLFVRNESAFDQDGGVFFQANQEILLKGTDLTAGGTLTDQQIFDNLLADGNLDVDT